MAPATWGEDMLVPSSTRCCREGARSCDGANMASDRVDISIIPGAVISGLRRPSRVGPALEKKAMSPAGWVIPNTSSRHVEGAPGVGQQSRVA